MRTRSALLALALGFFGCRAEKTTGARPTLVSLNPGATEMIFALGAEDHLLAVSDYCDWPPAARKLPRVGDLVKPNMEKIKELDPDYVIVFLPTQERLSRDLENMGLRTLDISPESGREVLSDIVRLGELLNEKKRARALADSLGSLLASVRTPARRPKVFVELSVNPLYTGGRNTFVDDVVRLSGGENIFRDAEGYFPVRQEEVLRRSPDVIVLAHWPAPKPQERIGWQDRGFRVVKIDPDIITRPGPRFVEGVMALNRVLGE